MDQEFRDFTAPIRIVTMLIAIFAAAALLLAFVGLYAAIAFHTMRKTREFGIRAALGGAPWQVMRPVLWHGLVMSMTGVAFGLALAAGVASDGAGFLFGVHPVNTTTYAAVTGFLTMVSVAACWIPARRAARSDPMAALREE